MSSSPAMSTERARAKAAARGAPLERREQAAWGAPHSSALAGARHAATASARRICVISVAGCCDVVKLSQWPFR